MRAQVHRPARAELVHKHGRGVALKPQPSLRSPSYYTWSPPPPSPQEKKHPQPWSIAPPPASDSREGPCEGNKRRRNVGASAGGLYFHAQSYYYTLGTAALGAQRRSPGLGGDCPAPHTPENILQPTAEDSILLRAPAELHKHDGAGVCCLAHTNDHTRGTAALGEQRRSPGLGGKYPAPHTPEANYTLQQKTARTLPPPPVDSGINGVGKGCRPSMCMRAGRSGIRCDLCRRSGIAHACDKDRLSTNLQLFECEHFRCCKPAHNTFSWTSLILYMDRRMMNKPNAEHMISPAQNETNGKRKSVSPEYTMAAAFSVMILRAIRA